MFEIHASEISDDAEGFVSAVIDNQVDVLD